MVKFLLHHYLAIQLSHLLCGDVVMQVNLWNNLSTFGIEVAKSEKTAVLSSIEFRVGLVQHFVMFGAGWDFV